MHFTQEDYKKIESWLLRNSVKDTEFQEALPLTGDESVVITQDNHNRNLKIKDFVDEIIKVGIADFLNVTERYKSPNITLKEAIALVPDLLRKKGQVITFSNPDGNWEIYQFTGALNQWNNVTLWEDVFNIDKFIINSILPDEEDLTKSEVDKSGNSFLSLKDREYNPTEFSGLGRVILRKKIASFNTPSNKIERRNILVKEDITKSNTIYEIRYDFNLNGSTIVIPNDCILYFNGGSIKNGKLILNNTLVYPLGIIKEDVLNCTIEGNFKKGQMFFDKEQGHLSIWDGTNWKIRPNYRVIDNKLNETVDGGKNWTPVSDYIASYFRWGPNNTIQINRTLDDSKWENLSGEFADSVFIKGYKNTYSELPQNPSLGDIYMVGAGAPYTMYVSTSEGWKDNGQFTSISAGVVQTTGQSTTEVMSQKAVTDKLTELESEVRNVSAKILVEGNVPNNSHYKYFPLEMRKGDKLTLSITNLSSDAGSQVRFLKTNDPASFWGGQLVMENVAVNKEIVVDDDYSFVGCWTSPSVSFDIRVSKAGNYNLASLAEKTDNISSELNDLSSELSDIVTTRLVELLSKDSKLSEGYLDLESGNFVAAPISGGGDAYTTDFLRVKENELLIIHIAHSYENNVLAMYDEQKGFISAIRTNNALRLEAIIPSNVAYIRYAFLANTLSELSITMTDKGISANSLSIQLGGLHEKTEGIVEIYDSVKCGVYEGAYLEQNGTIAPVGDASVSHLIPLCGSGDILFNPKATRGFQSSRFTFFDKDLNILSSDFSNSLRLACPDKAKYARFDMSIAFQEKEYIRQIAEIEVPSLLNSALNEMSLEKKVTRYLVNGDVASTGKADIYTLFKNIKKGYTYRITIMSKYATPSFSISTTNRIDSQLLNYMVEEDFITFSEEDIANAKTKLWTAKADALYASAWIPSLTEIVVLVEECESEIGRTSRMAESCFEAQRTLRYRAIMAGFPNSGKSFSVFGTYDLRYWEAFGNEFVPSKGSGFTRDPSLGIIGDYYYIVYTDASDWTMPCHTIGMARTKDFYTYEELDILECGTQFKKVWAPAFYMENGKVYIIYAATTTGGGDFQVYISEYNVANHSLSEPTRLDIGGLASVIDYHIHKIDGEYYAVGKDDLLFKTVIAKSSTLMGNYEIVLHENLSGVPEEGQFAMQISENRWRIFLNDYSVNQQILYIDVDSITSPQKFSSVGKISYEGEGIDAPLFHPSFIDNNFNEIDYPRMS